MTTKTAVTVQNAINAGATVINLATARAKGWDKVIGNVVMDTTPSGIPIVALIEAKEADGHIRCVTTCNGCGDGRTVFAQDLWQAVHCPTCKTTIRKEARTNDPRRRLKKLNVLRDSLTKSAADTTDVDQKIAVVAAEVAALPQATQEQKAARANDTAVKAALVKEVRAKLKAEAAATRAAAKVEKQQAKAAKEATVNPAV
jgi:hypothetical protein